VSVLEQLLSVQEHDTVLEQLRHRRDHLPERGELVAIDSRQAEIRGRRAEVDAQRSDLVREQRRYEDEIAALEAKVTEVDGQLYGGAVTSPRELQTLQDEIAALRRRADDLETSLLEILTALEPVDDTIEALDTESTRLAEEHDAVTARLAAAEAAVDGEIAVAEQERSDSAAAVPAEQMAEYESLRSRLGGIAIARLVGTSCGACHLSLSAVDIDRLRKLPADEPGTCEECGRMLVH
jgi:uncharacterized protein